MEHPEDLSGEGMSDKAVETANDGEPKLGVFATLARNPKNFGSRTVSGAATVLWRIGFKVSNGSPQT